VPMLLEELSLNASSYCQTSGHEVLITLMVFI
jgi:hypothetical protein